MNGQEIGNKTVRDIFVEFFGEEIATKILHEIQAAYNKGLRGQELEDYAIEVLSREPKYKSGSTRLVAVAIAIIVI